MVAFLVALVGLASPLSPYALCGQPTGASATILVHGDTRMSHPDGAVESGDQIAALAPDGSCAGVVTWDDDGAALTVWVDDPFTETREGLIPGEPVALAVWDASSGKAYESLTSKLKAPYGDPDVFMPDELYVLEGIAGTSGLPTDTTPFALEQNAPNPAHDRTRLAFSVGSDGPVSLDVFDALGRRVVSLLDDELTAGEHTIDLDVSALASGVYVYRLRAGGDALQRRLTVAR